MPVKPEARMSVYDLAQTSEFSQLSTKQAIWILNYCQNFVDSGICNPVSATLAAYGCAKEETARIFSYQVLAASKVRLTLSRFFGDASAYAVPKTASERLAVAESRQRKKLIAIVEKQLAAAAADHSHAPVARLTNQLERLKLGIKMGRHEVDDLDETESAAVTVDTPSTKFHPGQIVTQRDPEGVLHTGKVIAVDANGLPTKFEEIK